MNNRSTKSWRRIISPFALVALLTAGAVVFLLLRPLPTTSSVPAAPAVPGIDSYPATVAAWLDAKAPPDEAKAGRTVAGTPIQHRTEACFPAESRNLFNEVDMVPTGPGGSLQPFDYHSSVGISDVGRSAIRGRNTWMLWGEGNERFWDWLQQHGYGIADFLVLLDSRGRDSRFRDIGIINQPGMKKNLQKNILGLYLDQANGDQVVLRQPENDIDESSMRLAARPVPPPGHRTGLFKPGDRALYEAVIKSLPQDGVDTSIYGYPSGVVGLRLMPNPDFFGDTPAAASARAYWNKRVTMSRDAYYDKKSGVAADPQLVRPFRVSMSCAYCHVGPHPLNPPANPEAPEWRNLSSTIGAQYWTPPKTFSNMKGPSSFLYQFVASQPPGTIDTSLVSTDHINNPNTINAIFDVPSRLARAALNRPERQGPFNLELPGLSWDEGPRASPRYTPRILLDGADSIGAFGALARVYLNIGAYSEEWNRLHNPVIGFTEQRPFAITTSNEKSVYWRTTIQERVPYLLDFFTYRSKATRDSVTAPMKLANAPGGRALVNRERDAAQKGRQVFLGRCALCHSSKQPEDFELRFSRDWARAPVAAAGQPMKLTAPMDFAEWDTFITSDPFREYVRRITELAGKPDGDTDAFLKDNYLSTDIRIPITLVGTNSGRAVATNGMRGQIWDNFSSEDYKSLPAVGAVHFYNPYSAVPPDRWGNNDVYFPPGGGPGYYRPASLISLWATAPFLHNNSLGLYTHDPSVDGRLRAYDDAIDKLLFADKRFAAANHADFWRTSLGQATRDPGFIYRTTEASWIDFPDKFIRPLVTGIIGAGWTSFLASYFWGVLALGFVVLAVVGCSRHAGFLFMLVAVLAGLFLRLTRLDSIYATFWLVPGLLAAAALLLWLGRWRRALARATFVVLAGLSILASITLNAFLDGKFGGLYVGPIPKGTPVSLIMNLNPQAPVPVLVDAASGLARGILRVRQRPMTDAEALREFEAEAGQPLMRASKCPDFVMDRGHWFGESLSNAEKQQLKAFLRTL